MSQIKITVIERIVSNDKLKLKDEDMLLNFLIELYEKDHDILQLFEYVFFSNISEEGIKKFIDAFDIEYINNGTWKSICERILQGRGTGSSENTNEKRYAAVVDEIKHTEGQEFNGIMRDLTDEAGGNIHEQWDCQHHIELNQWKQLPSEEPR